MILTCHLLAGAAIAANISNPILALCLAFLSHYFLDALPQYEYSVENIKKRHWHKSFFDFFKVFLDIAFGALLIFLFSENTLLIFAAAFLAILPDSFTLLAIIFQKNKFLNKHWEFHQKINDITRNKKIPLFWRIFSQVLVVLITIFFLL
ncbi:hypothetical protein ES703_09802 [subsurface metagenome]